jgi:phosphoribosylformylglycinamidine (FGAM) synthase-like amidotransferase family enzyme
VSLRAGVIVFPGSNCDRDLAVAFERAGAEVSLVWHKESGLPPRLDLVAIVSGVGAQMNRSPALRISAPGNSPASIST